MRPRIKEYKRKIHQGIRKWRVELMNLNGGVQKHVDQWMNGDHQSVLIPIIRDFAIGLTSNDEYILRNTMQNAIYLLEDRTDIGKDLIIEMKEYIKELETDK